MGDPKSFIWKMMKTNSALKFVYLVLLNLLKAKIPKILDHYWILGFDFPISDFEAFLIVIDSLCSPFRMAKFHFSSLSKKSVGTAGEASTSPA
jgi:hypothetical protein